MNELELPKLLEEITPYAYSPRVADKISNIKFSPLENCKIITTKKAIKENNRYKKYFY